MLLILRIETVAIAKVNQDFCILFGPSSRKYAHQVLGLIRFENHGNKTDILL